MLRSTLLRGASAGVLTLVIVSSSAPAQEALPTIDIGAGHDAPADPPTPAATVAPGFSPERARLPLYRDPPGQTVTTLGTKQFDTTPQSTIADILQYSPGVTITQGNGPRDMGISIRGSNARNPFGIRNLVVMEDGFSITTADGGNSRTDALDPHAYGGFDVYRGPSSALFGNYAMSGAINFRMRTGAEINGFETGHEFGSFGYINNYLLAGKHVGDFDLSLFVSDVRGDGYINHTDYDTQTIDFLGTWSITPSDRLILKVIQNDLHTNMSARISQNQYYFNPYQNNYGCWIQLPINSPFCVAVPSGVFANGLLGARVAQSSAQLGLHRYNWRDIAGLRYEHDFDNDTTWRTQAIWDYTDNQQPTVPVQQTRGPTTAVNVSTDITSHQPIFGRPATHFLGFIYNNAHVTQDSYIDIPNNYYQGAVGPEQSKLVAFQSDIGLKAREEIALTEKLTGVVGFSTTWTKTYGVSSSFTYAKNGLVNQPNQVAAAHAYWNTAPEASFTYRIDPEWQIRSRFGTAYGTPYYQQLFTTSAGTAGDNTQLKTQTNIGVDLGADWTPSKNVTVSVTGFNEWFRNEQLTQIAPNGASFTTNAPASIHRGAEASIEWRPVEGWRLYAAYTHNNFFFTNFIDQIGPKTFLDRRRNQIPGVPLHAVTARLGYDQPYGALKGLGAFVEYIYRSSYKMDNGNLTWAPSYGIVNFDIHYSRDMADSWIKNVSVFFDVKNAFDRTYISSAPPITNTVAANGQQNPMWVLLNSGSIAAGSPRAFIGGVKFKF